MAVPIYGPQGAHCLKGPILLGASLLAINEGNEARHKVKDDVVGRQAGPISHVYVAKGRNASGVPGNAVLIKGPNKFVAVHILRRASKYSRVSICSCCPGRALKEIRLLVCFMTTWSCL